MSIKREAYLCLSAMLRAREPKLLNNDRAARMLDCSGFEEAAKILTDCGYADLSQLSAGEIESSLQSHRSEIFAEMERMSPQREVVDVFRMKYDYHNIKAILKSEAMELDPRRLLSDSGRISGEKLLGIYHNEQWKDMPGKLGEAAKEAAGVLARTNNPQLADFLLDKAYFSEIRDAAESADCAFLSGYAAILTDTANLKAAVRTVRMKKNADFLAEALVPGGSVPAEKILNASGKEAVCALYTSTPLEKAAALGAEAMDGGSMTAFELECDNAVNRYLRSARRVSYGPEAVIAYLAAVEGEITAVRMILTGRLAGIAPQTIRERLRDLYA